MSVHNEIFFFIFLSKIKIFNLEHSQELSVRWSASNDKAVLSAELCTPFNNNISLFEK